MRTNGALLASADLTNLIICSNWLSLADLSARAVITPSKFIEPLKSSCPCFLTAGKLSPVRLASSKLAVPSKITESTGTTSPGLMIILSLARILLTGTSSVLRPLSK